MKYQPESVENKNKCKNIEHYKKINIFGEEGVGKSSLIALMEHYEDDNFNIENEKEKDLLFSSQLSQDSFNNQSNLVDQVKRAKIPINEDNPLYASLYETNLGNYDSIKTNLDTLLLQTECVIIMWDNSRYDTFDNIYNLFGTINQGMNDFKYRKAPIFLIKNKSDLEPDSSQNKEAGNNIKNSIERIKKENPNIIYREISLLNRDNFLLLALDLNRNLSYAEQERNFINNDVTRLVKFKNYKDSKEFEFVDNLFEINCILLGHTCVGKTTFFNYFLGNNTKTNISSSSIEFLKLMAEVDKEQFYVKITDTLGQERFLSIGQQYIRKADGILLFFDVTKEESFKNVDNWISKIRENNEDCDIILLANKIDESDKRKVSKKEAKEKAENYKIKYYECCCLNGLNLYEILNEIILAGYRNYKKKENDEDFIKQRKNSIKIKNENQKEEIENKRNWCKSC